MQRLFSAGGRFLLTAGILLGIGAFSAGRLSAQATATITGTITDSSGAAIADAQVQVKNTGTGIAQNTVSDSQGRFRVPELIIGAYDVQATKTGFATVVRKGVTLTVGAQPVVDFQLAVGQQTQTVTVSGEVSQVETQSTAVGALVEQKQISELPLNGRNFTQLLTLAPGVTQIPLQAAGGGQTFYGNGQKYSIAGSRPSGTAYLLDDQDMVNFWNNGPGAGGLGTALGVEAIAEFQTLTNTYSTQFGGNGAVINASTKSGTNAFHGSGFEFLRNDKMEARNIFDGSTAPAFRQNQFGGSIGGPIKKDKLFFFFNYEGLRNFKAVTTQVVVPDQCAHQFLSSTVAPGVCGAAVAQNSNPQVAAAIAATMALYPNTATNELLAGGQPSGTGTTSVIDPSTGQENYLVGRVDYTVNDKSSIFARYVMDRAQRNFTAGVPYWPELDTTRDNFINVEERQIISSRLVNLAHIGFSRPWEDAVTIGSPTVANGVASPGTVASAGVHPFQFFGLASGRQDGLVQSFSGVSQIGAVSTLPFYLVPNKFSFGDDVVWTSGAHSVKAGITATRMRENTYAPFQVGGQWTFPSLAAFMAGTPSQISGQVSDQQNPTADAHKDYRYWVYAPYVDDQWKVSSTLTVTLGLRYSPTSAIGETRHAELQLLNPPYGTWTPITNSTQDNPSLKNFDPRVGIAWDPFKDHKTSIRASFGTFHNVIYSRDLNNWLQPPFITGAQTSTSTPALQYLGACATSCSPFTIAITPGVIPTNGSLNPPNSNYYYVSKTPSQQQWNFNIQREVMPNTVASIGYVGSHSIHMFMQQDFNYPTPCTSPTAGCFYQGRTTYITGTSSAISRLNPQYGALIFANTIAASHYHSLQTSLTRRFASNWQMQASYVLSKSMDDSSGTYGLDGGGLANSGTQPACLSCDTGLSNFNRKHNFRLSGIYTLPSKAKGVLGQVVNGWQVTGVYTYLSGAPLSPLSAANRVFAGSGTTTGRPDLVAGCDLYTGYRTINQWYNPNCFSLQPQGTFGNAGRNIIIGPTLWNLDNSLTKDWRVPQVSERFAVQFRAEFFNILNHPSLQPTFANTASGYANTGQVFAGNPGAGAQAPGVGLNASAGRIFTTSSAPRQIQLALKITF
jgi:hypothetical protein